MRTEQILYFLESVKAGSFTKAAAKLHLQQPSLREAVTNLENELGEPLLIRSKKGVTLTEFGQNALPYLQNIYDTYLFLLQSRNPEKTHTAFTVTVTSNLDYLMSSLYTILTQQLPNKTLKINYIDEPEQIINSIIRRTCDVGIVSDVCGAIDENAFYTANIGKTIEECTVFESPLVAVMSPQHPLAAKKVISINDLRKQSLIFSHSSTPIKSFLKKQIDIGSLECFNVFNHKLVENFCLSQNVITFLPREMSDSSFLVSRPFKEYMPMKFLLFYRKGELTQDITLLIRHLKNCIQQNIDISHPYPY